MSTYMAYDRDALLAARLALLRSLDELRALAAAITDPSTHEVAVHVAWARTALEQTWLPAVTRVLTLDVLTPFAPRTTDLRDLGSWANSLPWVMARNGWHVRRDPTRPPPSHRLTPAGARALAARLTADDPLTWSAEEWARLADMLDVLRDDAELAAHFRVNVGSWAPLLNALGVATFLAGADPLVVGRLAESLGAVLAAATGHACADARGVLPSIELLLPASQALLLPHLGLDPPALVGAGAVLMRDHPSTIAILLPALTAMPEVVTMMMLAMVDNLDLLYRSAPHEVVDAALVAAVDPRTASAAQAETIITSAGERLVAEGVRPGVLGALIAPWLLAFSPLSRRFETPPVELARLLAAAMAEPGSAVRLAEVAERPAPTLLDGATLDEAAALVGLVRQLALDTEVGETADHEAAWDTLWAVASITAALAGFAPGSGVAVTGLSLVVAHWFAPDAGDTERVGAAAMDRTLTAMAAAALADTVDRWRASGLTVPDPPTVDSAESDSDPAPSTTFLRAFSEWRRQLPGGPDGDLADRATRVVSALVSPASSGEHLAEAI